MKLWVVVLAAATSMCISAFADDRIDRGTRAIPLMRVVVSPEKFDGSRIRSVGFLAVDDGRLALFPSRDSYMADEKSASILVRATDSEQRELAKKSGRRYVAFLGDFRSGVKDGDALGELSNFRVLYSTDSKSRLLDPASNRIFVQPDLTEEAAPAVRASDVGHR